MHLESFANNRKSTHKNHNLKSQLKNSTFAECGSKQSLPEVCYDLVKMAKYGTIIKGSQTTRETKAICKLLFLQLHTSDIVCSVCYSAPEQESRTFCIKVPPLMTDITDQHNFDASVFILYIREILLYFRFKFKNTPSSC